MIHFSPPPRTPALMLEVSDHWPLANSRDGRRQGAENALMAGPLLQSDTERKGVSLTNRQIRMTTAAGLVTDTASTQATGGGGGATRKQASSTWQHNLPPSHSVSCRIVPPAPCVPVRGVRAASCHDASNTNRRRIIER